MVWRNPFRALAVGALISAALAPGHARVEGVPGDVRAPYDARPYQTRLHDGWLVAAAGTARVLEPRLTGGFAHGRATSLSASSSSSASSASAASPVSGSSQLFAAASRLQTLANADPAPDHLRALGVAYLLIGSNDEARDALERALAAAPDDPRTLTDLSAALLAPAHGAAAGTGSGPGSEETWDTVRALDHAERAWRLAPAMPEAAFNTALARERLHLRSEARKAWLAVERIEPGSPWAAEASSHIAALSAETSGQAWSRTLAELTSRLNAAAATSAARQIDADGLARRFPQAIREYLHAELLPSWGVASLNGDAETAARRLSVATALCTALADNGDGSCRDLIQQIADTEAAPMRMRAGLAAAYRDYGLAMTVYRANRFAESETLLTRARDAFIRASSPQARWCDVHLAVVDLWGGRAERAGERLRDLMRRARDDDFAFRGRVSWLLGLYEVGREDFASALTHYERGNAAFERAHETENRARVDLLTAEVLAKMGSRREAWQRYHRALASLGDMRAGASRHTLLVGASFASLEDELPSAALSFQNELLTGSPSLSEPVAVTEGHLYSFEALARLGDVDAPSSLKRARQALGTVADPSLNRRLEAEITLREGRVSSRAQPRQAVDLLTRSLELFQGGSFLDRLPEVFQARGEARLLARDEASAQTDFLAGLSAVETRARALHDDALRASALEPAWPLTADLIGLWLGQGRVLNALAQAERAKMGSLARSGNGVGSSSGNGNPNGHRNGSSNGVGTGALACDTATDARCWTRVLPADVAVIYYAQLADRLAIWVITPSGIEPLSLPVSPAAVRARVNQYRRALEQGQPDARLIELSSALFDQILRPVHARVRTSATLVVVPDDALHGVPFAALFDAERRRYLIEDHTVIVSPAFMHFAASITSTSDWRDSRTLRAIVVTNPKTTGLISEQLPRLPGAEAEAAHMAKLFGDVRILRDGDATKSHLREALAGGRILHVASHARVNYRTPWRSYFVLAPDGGRPGEDLLLMSEISTLPLAGLRLAVLAACGSADGPVALGGASLSLARPFLSAGVPDVVASLWPVSDRAARALFTDFYSHVVQGTPPATALRAAQLAMLHSSTTGLQSPTFWAPFVAIGGTTASGAGGGALSTHSTLNEVRHESR